jgi:hypothetical protein
VVNSSHQQHHKPERPSKEGELGDPTIMEECLKPRGNSWSWWAIPDETQMYAGRHSEVLRYYPACAGMGHLHEIPPVCG